MAKPKTKEAPKNLVVLKVERVPLDKSGYTKSGTYFGVGAPLWRAYIEDCSPDLDWRELDSKYLPVNKEHARAPDKEAAKAVFANYFTPYGYTVKCK